MVFEHVHTIAHTALCKVMYTFWLTRSVTMSLAWTSTVMREVMILRCKVGSCPRTNTARAFSLWNTHTKAQTHTTTKTFEIQNSKNLVKHKCRFDFKSNI